MPGRIAPADAHFKMTSKLLCAFYFYRKGIFEQDIVLLESPQPPDVFGLDPDTTRLEVITEFLDPPVPDIASVSLGGVADSPTGGDTSPGDVVDEQISFGGHLG